MLNLHEIQRERPVLNDFQKRQIIFFKSHHPLTRLRVYVTPSRRRIVVQVHERRAGRMAWRELWVWPTETIRTSQFRPEMVEWP